ncbi:MAG: hypothetical protein AAGU27_02220 [Dehalobacterium sp.]
MRWIVYIRIHSPQEKWPSVWQACAKLTPVVEPLPGGEIFWDLRRQDVPKKEISLLDQLPDTSYAVAPSKYISKECLWI